MSLESAKKQASYQAVLDNIKNGDKVGIGSGSTVKYAVDCLKENANNYRDCVFVPTSFQSRQLIIEAGLKLSDLSITPQLDITIDGADEVDENFNLIKGGGGCQLQEKIVIFNSKTTVIVADYTKNSKNFGDNWKNGIPIEVSPMAYVPIMKRLQESPFNLNPVLRMAVKKAGPVVTDNSNFILDAKFTELKSQSDIDRLSLNLNSIPGLIEHGLFVNLANKVYFGNADGSVTVKSK